uniref:Microtubule-associated protein 65-7 n=1 Tax=Sedum alfredii TaxID=439688 RepID=A0A8E4XWD7_9MAGN|nr:microtubule-associated protein 65-7 [Sedum alfredii]
MLLELEKECLEIYRRKVDDAANTKARLHQSVAAKEAELATLMASLGELRVNSPIPTEKKAASLKEKLAVVSPLLEDLRAKRNERKKQFTYVKEQLDKITEEISGYSNLSSNLTSTVCHEEDDLSLRKLTEYQNHLRVLQKEKADRVTKILEYVNEVHSLCAVLGTDFGKTVSDVHPSLHVNGVEQSTNIGNNVLEGLEEAIHKLKLERKARYLKLKNLASLLSELWNLMDSQYEDKIRFSNLTFFAGSSETQITQPGLLNTEMIEQASEEVERLKTLKASRMKQLVMNKRSELEEICRVNHIEPDTSTTSEKVGALIDAGLMDPSELLSSIESQIVKAKQEAASRQDIMDRIGRWLSACEEEIWLEEYNLDGKRYSAGRGAHLNLKRAERARVTVSKIPTILDNLITKTLAWEKEKGVLFLYDGVRLLSILEEYKLTRKRKEEATRISRDQKKLQDMLVTEKESMYGSKPSPRRSNSFRRPAGFPNGNGSMTPNPRRSSVGSPTPDLQTPRSYSGRQNGYFSETRRLSTGPLNFVNIRKEDTLSCTSTSFCDSESSSQI